MKELKHIDIDDLPELLRLAREVRETKEPHLLRREGEELAILVPVPAATRRGRKGRPLTKDDPLFRLVGIGKSGGAWGRLGQQTQISGGGVRPPLTHAHRP